MKLAIIGTSHVAKILSAQRAHFPELAEQWDCYPVPNGLNDGLGLSAIGLDRDNKRLTGFPGRGNMKRALDLTGYDAFVLVGGQSPPVALAMLKERTLSASFREAAARDLLTRNNNLRLFQAIRSVSDAPVAVATCLMVARGTPHKVETLERAEAEIAEFWTGRGATFLPQPRETLGPDMLTRPDCQMGGGDNHLTTEAAVHQVRQIRDAMRVPA